MPSLPIKHIEGHVMWQDTVPKGFFYLKHLRVGEGNLIWENRPDIPESRALFLGELCSEKLFIPF